MAVRHVAHVLVLHDVLVIDQHTRVARVPVAAVVMNVQLLVVEAVVGARAAPRRERADVGLGPRVVRVVHGQCRHTGTVQVVWIECVAVELQFWLLRRLVACLYNYCQHSLLAFKLPTDQLLSIEKNLINVLLQMSVAS